MSGYITAYICKTENVITHVTDHFHVAPVCKTVFQQKLTNPSLLFNFLSIVTQIHKKCIKKIKDLQIVLKSLCPFGQMAT